MGQVLRLQPLRGFNSSMAHMLDDESSYTTEDRLKEILEDYHYLEKMSDDEKIKVLNRKEGYLQTVGLFHESCEKMTKKNADPRGSAYYCPACEQLFPEKYIKLRLDLIRGLVISGHKFFV